MVDQDDRDAVVVGDALDAADGSVVGLVRRDARWGWAAHLGEHVDDDYARGGLSVQPVGDQLVPALTEGRAGGHQGQGVGRGPVGKELSEAGLEPAGGVLQGQVEHGAGRDVDAAEGGGAGGDGLG